MSKTTPMELLAAVSPSLDGATALAADCYRDPAFFDLEVERMMRREWHPVARHDELPNPGDYRSLDLFGESVLLVRDGSGRLRAYSRVCLHRASVFVQGEGNAKSFSCPYHRWTYDLEGRLRGAPCMNDREGFDRGALRLPELPVEQWQGWILLNLDPDAPPLAPRLESLNRHLDPWKLEELRMVETLEYDSPWNWKVMVENYIESYHHMGPHAESLHPIYPAEGTYAEDVEGPCVLLENPGVKGVEPFWVCVVFPTLMLTLTRDEARFTTWYEMQIDRHDHFVLRIHLLLPEPLASNEQVVAEVRKTVEKIHAEDIPMCKGVQRGLASRLWRPGLLAEQEKALWLFHRYLAEKLGADLRPASAS